MGDVESSSSFVIDSRPHNHLPFFELKNRQVCFFLRLALESVWGASASEAVLVISAEFVSR